MDFAISFQMLEQQAQKHGVFAAADANGNFVSFVHELVFAKGLNEFMPDIEFEFTVEAALDLLGGG